MKITGWLTPKGNFVGCGMWEHVRVAINHPEFFSIPRIWKLKKELESMEKDCQASADREGDANAEWHVYEMLVDSSSKEIWKTLLNNGFIRVGEVDGDLHFEGRPNVLKSRYQSCRDFADEYAAKAIFEPCR